MTTKKPLFDDHEHYVNNEGLFVMTAAYLLKRGYCCGNGCLHCPFDYKQVLDPVRREKLLAKRLLRHEESNQEKS